MRLSCPSRSLSLPSAACSALLAGLIVAPGFHPRMNAAEGQPPASGRAPESQGEKDWVDNRWSRTEIGQFLASNVAIPDGRIAKPLSIKVGNNNEGTVCFDTAQCTLRAAWLGGFLEPNPARFGLIHSPKIIGAIQFTAPPSGWAGGPPRYGGLHLHNQRVTLEYSVGSARVLESPWLAEFAGTKLFTRSFEIAPRMEPLSLALADHAPENAIQPGPRSTRAAIDRGSDLLCTTALGDGIQLAVENGKLIAKFPASEKTIHAKLLVWTGAKEKLPQFDDFEKAAGQPEDFATLLQPGAARWLPELKTTGQRGSDSDILAVDTLTAPYDNPWKALLFMAGVDFTPDGTAYVCTIHGDVWRVTGIDSSLKEIRWKRFATGLFQALGLKVRNGEVFVLGRDQITRLHDLNGDGEADFYENFCNLIQTSGGGHDYVTSLEKDDAGNFYFVDPRGAHRVSADGRRMDALGTGFRNANGLGVSPDGAILTVAPQQGEWTPSSEICEIKPGGYYGYGGPKAAPDRPLGRDLPLCWIPHRVDNSSGSQVWVPKDQWGPFGGKMIHLLWGRCALMLALRDTVDGVPQGAVVPLPGRLLSGPNRGSFNSRDGQLYVAGSTGWQTSSVKDGALQRVRFTGRKVQLPTAWHAHANGISLTFTEPLDRATAADAGSFSVHQWNYRYAAQYGSKDWSAADPSKEGRDEVPVKSARLGPDGKTLFLEMSGLKPVMQMEIQYNLDAADGKPLRGQLWLTLNRLDTPHP